MKRITSTFLTILIVGFSFAQENESKKNFIYVEFYQPIQTPSLREFYNDEWVMSRLTTNFCAKLAHLTEQILTLKTLT